jgi:hypothetical protein
VESDRMNIVEAVKSSDEFEIESGEGLTSE